MVVPCAFFPPRVNRTASALRDPPGDLLLHGKDILYVPVVTLGPQVIARRGIHQLRRDPHAVVGLAHTALEHIPHPQLPTHLIRLDRLAFVGEDGVPGNDEQPWSLERSVMRSSVIPSLKYSCSGSPLMLTNGSTAMDGLSGSASAAVLWPGASAIGHDGRRKSRQLATPPPRRSSPTTARAILGRGIGTHACSAGAAVRPGRPGLRPGPDTPAPARECS